MNKIDPIKTGIPVISFITVCYNGLNDTCELIESMKKMIHSLSYEIIVVDNASVKNEAEELQSRYPEIKAIRSEQNLGFAGGNNKGIRQAIGKYIFLINNDTFIEEDGLSYLIERLESNPQIGAVSPKIRFAFPPRNIQFAGFTPLSSVTLRNESIGFGCPDDGSFDTPHPSPYLHGAAMILKREAITKVGLMSESYFLYYEEMDWCVRLNRAGYELWYEPRCTVFHKESQSTGQASPLRTFYMTRNRLLFAQNNLQGMERILSILYQLTIVVPKNILTYAGKRKWKLAQACLRGACAFITFTFTHKLKKHI